MARLALAVHGVSNRKPDSFERVVAGLQELGGGTMPPLRPVFWGDLGPEGPLLALPGEEDVAEVPEPARAVAEAPSTEALAAATTTADATLEELARRTGDVPAGTAALLQEAAREAAAAGYTLALQAELAPLLADAVLAAPPAGSSAVQPSAAFGMDWVKDRLVDVFARAQDAVVNAVVRGFRELEGGLGSTIVHSVGDVFMYETRGPEIRGRIDDAYRAAAEEADDVDIVAHSLGALASVEWLLGASVASTSGPPTDPAHRRVRHLVTFGAQVSLFSELQGLLGAGDVPRASTNPQVLPIRVQRWSNVWQELDPLAFVMSRVFRIEVDGVAGMVQDLRLTQRGIPTNVSFHSSYWRDERFARWLAGLLGD